MFLCIGSSEALKNAANHGEEQKSSQDGLVQTTWEPSYPHTTPVNCERGEGYEVG